MTSLTAITLWSCTSLSSIPEGISCLTGLIRLSVFQSPGIQSLPAGISRLTNLTELTLLFSGFTSLPSGITKLSGVDSFLMRMLTDNPLPGLLSLPDVSELPEFTRDELQTALQSAIHGRSTV